MRKKLLFIVALVPVITALGGLVVGCGGSGSVTIPPAGSEGGPGLIDGSVTDSDTTSNDASSGGDADPTPDGGGAVHELPSPVCNDLVQQAPLVPTTDDPAHAPDPVPLTIIAPGLYVVKQIIDHGDPVPGNLPSRTTAYFTTAREYYVRDDSNGMHSVYSLDWKLTNGKLVRTILCSSAPGTTSVPSYDIGASTNGFTVFIDRSAESGGATTELVRYERVP